MPPVNPALLPGGRRRFRKTLFDLTGGSSLPQILFEDRSIGGYTELWRLDATGALDETLAARRKTPP